ncbi:ABC transporter permease [Lapillicoccus jejuensis]|uniref:Osmoprotectant transport system permease protein n=1 Tax=Lapillicoccus jejuensis TaxID=402171 RepID=A0A542DYE2_9MICO|nr:ABC transporter permease [Lapillicoccus jejuensis]TQJ08107.1 osmoprotectant transport system permease protein [Lapillicoccus jejuensis]
MIAGILGWLTDPANRSDIIGQTLAHLRFSVLAVVVAALIAIPLGLWIGHTGRGKIVAVTLTGAARAIPTLGLLFLIVLVIGPHVSGDLAFSLPSEIVLVVLAIPPILSGTYAGIDEVDPAARDAAKGMGMRGWEVLRKVEIPCALPLFLSGLRSAFLQVIATATIAASVGLDGLGRFLIDGQAVRDYDQMASGAVLVALLAIVVDLLLALVQRLVVSPGLSGRAGRGRRGNTRSDDDAGTTDPTTDARTADAAGTSRDRDETLVTTTTASEI